MWKIITGFVAIYVSLNAIPPAYSDVRERWKAELVDIPGQPNMCIGWAGTKFGFEITGDRLIAGNQTTYRGLFDTKIGDDGNIRLEYTAPGGYRLEMVGNVKTKAMHLRNLSSGCRWNVVATP
ncbi:MAG: hypothetical protein K9G48_08345 [Reyranella sp.]|nr:hypothetical protein [Reyranella sp.]